MTELDITQVMTHAEAVAVTDSIHDLALALDRGLEGLAELVNRARDGRADVALGYKSWPDYVVAVVGSVRTDDRDQRRVLVGWLSDQGLSTRAIAPIVNVDPKTIRNDLRPTGELSPVEPAEPPAPQPITGLNGKTYQRPDRRPPPIVEPRPSGSPPTPEERAASDERAADAIRKFLYGWVVASRLRRDPNRERTLAALNQYDREKFLAIEKEHLQ